MIDILLAAYNGEKYISEQIESIINQTYTDWILYIKDDCSTDRTVDIVREYEKKYSGKIKLVLSEQSSGSAKNNFFSMLKYSKHAYVMTCDQDDIWLPDKIELTYNKMKETEKENKEIPILVHTDLKVVDENLNIISESLFALQNMNSNRDKINNILVQNIVTGCTVMVNRNLLSYIIEIPKNAIMHDWWMALVASSLGKIAFVNSSTMLYRQHGKNSVGAKDTESVSYIFKKLRNVYGIKISLYDTYVQAEELLTTMGKYLDKSDCFLINKYVQVHKVNKIKKVIILLKFKFLKNSYIRILGQLLFC